MKTIKIFFAVFKRVIGQGLEGVAEVVVEVKNYSQYDHELSLPIILRSSLKILFTKYAHIEPRKLTIWNEKTVFKSVDIISGSGIFIIKHFDRSIIDASLEKNAIIVYFSVI